MMPTTTNGKQTTMEEIKAERWSTVGTNGAQTSAMTQKR